MRKMFRIVWNDLGRQTLSGQPGFDTHSSEEIHSILAYLCGTLYCYVLDDVIYHWDTVYGVPDVVGTIESD
jgi:hypothetical protein